MRTRLVPIAIAAVLAGCASQTDRELEAVKSARSVLAEWALVEQQGDAGRAEATYVEQTRRLAREQLEVAGSALTGWPDAARLIEQIRAGSPDATALKRANAALEPLENRLEAS